MKSIGLLVFLFLFLGCAVVKQKDRGTLSDPMLKVEGRTVSESLDEESELRREGRGMGGATAGGGCGC